MNPSNHTILVADDDARILSAIELRLKSRGHRVVTAPNGSDALTLARMVKPDLVIADIWMAAGSGLSLAYRLRQCLPGTPIIILTASKIAELREMAQQVGAVAFLEKPYDPETLLTTVEQALETADFAGCPAAASVE